MPRITIETKNIGYAITTVYADVNDDGTIDLWTKQASTDKPEPGRSRNVSIAPLSRLSIEQMQRLVAQIRNSWLCIDCFEYAHNLRPDMGDDVDWHTGNCDSCKSDVTIFRPTNA